MHISLLHNIIRLLNKVSHDMNLDSSLQISGVRIRQCNYALNNLSTISFVRYRAVTSVKVST